MIRNDISYLPVWNYQIISVSIRFASLCQIPVMKSVLQRLSIEEYNSL